MPCAFALHLTFPRENLVWLGPFALAGLFAAWMSLAPRRAALLGYLCGVVYFSANFDWFGETAGALLGPLGFVLDIGPAIVESIAFALAAAIAASAVQRLQIRWVPIVSASGFTLAELLRSSGVLGVPLYQIGVPFIGTPLAPVAAFSGVYGLTFVVALAAATLAVSAVAREGARSLRRIGATLLAIGVGVGAAWWWWPARVLGPATMRVAAIQGNIRQSVKWQPESLPRAVATYTTMTAQLGSFKPRFVLWPETVITTDLLFDPAVAAVPANADLVAQARALRGRFFALARRLDAVIAVGTTEATATSIYNDLVYFQPDGTLDVYRKRQLVPFAEFLPGPRWLRGLPFASLVSDFGSGQQLDPLGGTLAAGSLICWEAGFGDLAQQEAQRGAAFFAIATDDAWFGTSDGPYAQAQLAPLRAVETGRWVIRAGATGISGIIAPDGRWQTRSELDTIAIVRGTIGAPQPTLYSRIGPWAIGALLVALAAAGFAAGRRGRPA